MATGANEVIRNLERWGKRKQREIELAGKLQIAPKLERYAKQHRPWTDRTGNARRGLHAKAIVSTHDVAIQLHHGVTYGVYLELGYAGRFAILKPTMDKHRNEMIRIIEKIWRS